MAEREQRLLAVAVVPAVPDEDALVVAGVAVGAGPALGAGDGALVGGGRERDRQPAARVGVAEHDRGHRLAELLPGMPCLEHRSHLVEPGHQHRAAGVEDHDGAGVGGRDGGDELVLVAGRASDVRSIPSPTAVLANTTATSQSAASCAASWMRMSDGCHPSWTFPPIPRSMTGQAVRLL